MSFLPSLTGAGASAAAPFAGSTTGWPVSSSIIARANSRLTVERRFRRAAFSTRAFTRRRL
jgi:hypothetical protein